MRTILLIFVVCLSAFSFENLYTFSGDYSYGTVLNALAIKTSRSVLGATTGLELKRHFDIYKKPFFIAVEHVAKNAMTDGYVLDYDSSCFYLVKNLDSMRIGKNGDTSYTVYLKFAKRYLITKDRQEYLNAKEVDIEGHKKDSLMKYEEDSLKRMIKWNYVYKCDLYIIGSTADSESYVGVNVPGQVGFNVRIYPFNLLFNQLELSGGWDKMYDTLNFRRHIIFYIRSDSSENLIFGNDIRQVNSQMTSSTGAVTTTYEDVYDGLYLNASPSFYKLTYRINTNQITLTGVKDSLIVGSSVFKDDRRERNWGIFTNRTKSGVMFYLASMMHCCKIDSEKVKEEVRSPGIIGMVPNNGPSMGVKK